MIANLIYLLVSFFKLLSRKKFYFLENRIEAKELTPNKNYIMAVWHNNLVTCILNAETPMISMTSRSKDGTIAADTAKKFNIYSARGSSSRGGKEAMFDMIKKIKETNYNAGLTIDGPRGPVHEPKPGIFKIAKETGVPILPYCAVSTRRIVFNSWDKLKLPLPFGTMRVGYGKPFLVTQELTDENIELLKSKLKSELIELESHLINM